MFRKFFQLFFAFFIISAAVVFAHAQDDASSRDGSRKEDFPKGIQESLAKQRIERDKKDFAELLDRSEEAAKLSDELEKSFAQKNQFSTDDQKKLDRLEKIVKKIRNEMGGDTDDDDDQKDKPSNVSDALKFLQTSTAQLTDQLKQMTRYTVSVIALQTSNSLLKAVRFLRLGKN